MAEQVIISPQPGPQTIFMQQKDDVPLVFYGGAAGGGKSYALLMDCLKYIDCPYFYGVYFRKTVKQLERTLWPEAKDMFYPFLIEHTGPRKGRFKGKAQIREKDKKIIFPTGATIEFSYLDNDQDCKENWQGAQLTAAYFDEFGHFSKYCFNYIRTRMRSKSKYKSFIRCSLNPEPNHFVLEYLQRYINDQGFARKDLMGKPAYFIVDKGEVISAWTAEELKEKYPNKKPRLYTFIPSSLEDNPAMLESNEDYADDLLANDPANAAMLLDGNWKYKPAANGMFDKGTMQIVPLSNVPLNSRYLRAWDKASSKPSKEGGDSKQLDPDYTASIKFAKDRNGFIYIMGDYVREGDGSQRSRFREKPGVRDAYISEQAKKDGDDVIIYLPKDPGQGGEVEFLEASKKLQAEGFTVKKDPSPSNKSKRFRFESFCSACYTGTIFWVKETFDPSVWDYMIMELENFDGDKNNGYHDDLVDSFSTAYAGCIKEKVYVAAAIPRVSAPTLTKRSGLNTRH